MIEEHYKEHYDRLRKLAGRILEDPHLGEDCAQQTYEMAIKYFASFDAEKGSIDVWLNRIFFNQLNNYRKFKRDKGIVKEFDVHAVEIKFPELLESHRGLSIKEIGLDGHEYQQEVLSLFLIQGYKAKEIAEFLDMSLSAVNKTVDRFRKHLLEKYS